VSQLAEPATRDELRRLEAEYVADALLDYRQERRRLEATRRELEAELVQTKLSLKDLDEDLVGQLLDGRAAGLEVQTMAQRAGISRSTAHRLLSKGRGESRWRDLCDFRDPATGMTTATARELTPLGDDLDAIREAWRRCSRSTARSRRPLRRARSCAASTRPRGTRPRRLPRCAH
jgi:AraC-like DNA-binding protein